MTLSFSQSLSILALVVLSGPALAGDCPDLDLRFAGPRGDQISALAAYDDGSGARLFAGGGFYGVTEWNGERWADLSDGFDGTVRAIVVHDFGSGPELVAGGDFVHAGGATVNRIARWNGSSWSTVGAGFDGRVLALAIYDDGAGPKLVAAGQFTSSAGASVARIASFDGSAWNPLGGGLDADAMALAVFDDGSGANLVAGGTFQTAGGVACAHVARWNGSSWAPIAGGTDNMVRALLAHGAPGAQALIAGGSFTIAGGVAASAVARFDGAAWSALGPGLHDTVSGFGGVFALLADGAGFIAGGAFETFAPPGSVSTNVARWDGAGWNPIGQGLGVPSYVGVDALARFDPNDGGGERLFAGGGFLPAIGQPRTIAQWNGASWSGLLDGNAQGLVHAASERGGADATMWQGELVVVGEFGGAGSASDARGIARWDGSRWRALGTVPAMGYIDHPIAVATLDLGAGPELFMGMSRHFTSDSSVPAYRWNGTNWTPLSPGAMPPETTMRVSDLVAFDDGTGARLHVAGQGLRTTPADAPDVVLRWDGSAWSRLGAGPASTPSQLAWCLEEFDDGSGSALYAGGSIPGGVQRWDGASWTIVGAGFAALFGVQVAVVDLEVFDDGLGPKLYAAGSFHSNGGVGVNGIARWNGASWEPVPGAGSSFSGGGDLEVFDDGSGAGERLFALTAVDDLVAFDGAAWTTLGFTEPYFTGARIRAFDDLPGGRGIAIYGNFREVFELGDAPVAQAGFTILRACPPVASFCSGDGLDPDLTVGCPCANLGAAGHGCAWSSSGVGVLGAHLGFAGSPSNDDLVLLADSMPASGSSLFFQGAAPNPNGAIFGDGLRCAASPIVRLRTRTNVAGAAQVPIPGEPSLSTIGGVAPGSGVVRAYQVWYRVAASFCTSAPFNTTNALRVHW